MMKAKKNKKSKLLISVIVAIIVTVVVYSGGKGLFLYQWNEITSNKDEYKIMPKEEGKESSISLPAKNKMNVLLSEDKVDIYTTTINTDLLNTSSDSTDYQNLGEPEIEQIKPEFQEKIVDLEQEEEEDIDAENNSESTGRGK